MAYTDHEDEINNPDSQYLDQEELDYGHDTYFGERLNNLSYDEDSLIEEPSSVPSSESTEKDLNAKPERPES